MVRLYKSLVTALLATMFAATTVVAAEGVGIGVILSSSTFDTAGDEYENGELNSTSISEDVEFPALFVEYKSSKMGSFSLTTGIEVIPGSATLGAKSRSDTASDTNESNADTKTYSAKAKVENYWGIYFEPTYAVSDNVGVYLKGGVSTLTVVSLEDLSSGTDSSTYGNEDVMGGTYGVGITGDLLDFGGAYFKVEYAKTEYEPVKLTSSTGNGNIIKADTEQEAIRLAIGYSF